MKNDHHEDWKDNSTQNADHQLKSSDDVTSDFDQVPHSNHVIAVDGFPEFEEVDEVDEHSNIHDQLERSV